MAKGLDGKKLPAGITQRTNGLYMGRVTYHGTSHTLYDRNLTELKKKMVDLRYTLEHGTFVKESKLTFDDWFDEWITTYKQNTVKQGTVESYKKHYSAYLKKPLGKLKLADIRAEHLQKVLNTMSKEGYADDTIMLTYCVLSGAFKQAYKNELIAKNPFHSLPDQKEKQKKKELCSLKNNKKYICSMQKNLICVIFFNWQYARECVTAN